MKEKTLTIKFPNQALLEDFSSWLCAQGEQDYFNWADIHAHKDPIVRFQYHSGKPEKFLKNNTIVAHNK
jgi:hypothetical protein